MSEPPERHCDAAPCGHRGSTRSPGRRGPRRCPPRCQRVSARPCPPSSPPRGVRPVEQGEGDSFVAAFARAFDAVACALPLQQVRPAAPAAHGPPHWRSPVARRRQHPGPSINRAARLRDAVHCEQVVFSRERATWSLISCPPVRGSSTSVCTRWDLDRPEHVFQLTHPDLPQRRPAAATSGWRMWREQPARPADLLRRSGTRGTLEQLLSGLLDRHLLLVTLTGLRADVERPGWPCRPRPASAADFADGVCYVDLAPITASRRGAGRGRACARTARPARPLDRATRCCGSSATVGC